ncbi:MAG: ATP-dependent helicase, partial [Planctomycetota bacterium]
TSPYTPPPEKAETPGLPLFSGRPEEGRGGDELNEDQREAVHHTAGPLLIVAGPGTGKTRTAAHRIARLIETGTADPGAILAVTFTNQAAAEMKERIRRILPKADSEGPTVCTFHALCARLLRDVGRRNFTILGEAEAAAILETAADGTGRRGKKHLKGLSGRIAEMRNGGLTPDQAKADDRFEPEFIEAYRAYEEALERAGALDFDGLLFHAVRLLEEDPGALAAVRDQTRWIIVDEYQDINALQYALVRLLAPGYANLCAIGDPDQAIYGFRGSDPGFFRRFAEDYPGAKVVRLKRNYRSADTILSAASQVMEKSAEGFGGPVASGIAGEKIVTPVLASEKGEAEFVAHTIEKEMGGVSFFSQDSGRVETGAQEVQRAFSDFAVLYRTEAQGAASVEALQRLGIPCRGVGTNRLLDKEGYRAVVDRLRTCPPGRKERVAELLLGLSQEISGFAADAARSLATLAGPFGTDLRGYVNHLTLASEVDAFDPRADRVACMTMHAAKGLEFPVVFVVACEDGVIPFRFGETCDNLEEERRLFFVACTRAKEKLFLCRAKKRMRYGKPVKNPPSPFLADIERILLEEASLPRGKRRKPRGPKQLDLFGK